MYLSISAPRPSRSSSNRAACVMSMATSSTERFYKEQRQGEQRKGKQRQSEHRQIAAAEQLANWCRILWSCTSQAEARRASTLTTAANTRDHMSTKS
jgi:hypothetical protein